MERIRVRFVEIRPGPQIDDPEPVQLRLSFIDSSGRARVWPVRGAYSVGLRPGVVSGVDQVVFDRAYPGQAETGGRASASLRVSMEKHDPAGRPAPEVLLMWGLLVLLGAGDGVFFGWLFDSWAWGIVGLLVLGGLGWMVGWLIARRVRHLYPREVYCRNKYAHTWYEGGAGQQHQCRAERLLPPAATLSGRKAWVDLVFVQE
jgi:hypothetical protein